jgi:maleate cis-trans isomerase
MTHDTALTLGLIVPINNTTMERELLFWLPPGSICRTLRIPRGKGLLTREAIPAYQAASLSLARTFPPALDVIVYGCTAAGFIAGPEADAWLAGEIRAMHGTPVVTTARAMVVELQAVAARRIGLVTPYSDQVNEGLTAFLGASDIAVARIERLPAPDVEALGRLTEDDVEQAALRLVGADIDSVFIACSQLPTAGILASLQDAIGVPVLSSIRASAAQVLQVAHGTNRPLPTAS